MYSAAATLKMEILYTSSFFELSSSAHVHVHTNHAGQNGGAFFVVGKEMEMAFGARLVISDNTAQRNGGGVFLRGEAAISLVPEKCDAIDGPCSSSTECHADCFSRACNWAVAGCDSRFEQAGQLGQSPCSRDIEGEFGCSLSFLYNLQPGSCTASCFSEQCSWGKQSESCSNVLDSAKSCPLFDALAFRSLKQQSVFWSTKAGTSRGLARCTAACQNPNIRPPVYGNGDSGKGALVLGYSEWAIASPTAEMQDRFADGITVECWVDFTTTRNELGKLHVVSAEGFGVSLMGHYALLTEVQEVTTSSSLPIWSCRKQQSHLITATAGILSDGDGDYEEYSDCMFVLAPESATAINFFIFEWDIASRPDDGISFFTCENVRCEFPMQDESQPPYAYIFQGGVRPPHEYVLPSAVVQIRFTGTIQTRGGFNIVFEAAFPAHRSPLLHLQGSWHHVAGTCAYQTNSRAHAL